PGELAHILMGPFGRTTFHALKTRRKRLAWPQVMQVMRSILLVCLTLMASCASHPKPNFSADWNSRIGSYTYEQAVAELGRPVVSGESSEGKTAEWTIRKSAGVTFGIGVGQGFYGPHSSVGV